MNPIRRAIGPVLIVVVAAACSGGGDDDNAEAATTATSEASVTSTSGPPASTDATTTTTTRPRRQTTTTTTVPTVRREPLTGVPLGRGERAAQRPALVVKIDNAPGARSNHSGLAVADIVFEEIVEADITRFAAVFHSQGSDVVGPIRSGRTQDVDLFTSFGTPLFAWSGGNAGVERIIAEAPFVDLNATEGGQGYYRGPGSQPHDLYNSTSRLWEQTPADHPNRALQQFRYVLPGESFGGEPVTGFDVKLRSIDVEWRWDEDRKQFVRAQEGGTHNDSLHGPIGAANVVVMVVEYRPSVVDARSPEAQTVGQGPVHLFARGRHIEGRWWRDSADDPIKFVALDGVTPLELVPGITWVELAEARIETTLLDATADLTIY